MTPQQIVGLGVRLLAVWIAIRSIGIFFMNAAAFRAMDMTDKALNTSLLTGWWLAVAALLWLFPMWIAHRLIPRTRFESKLMNIQPREVARVGCCLIGLWLLSNYLGTLIWFLFKGALTPGTSSVIRSFTPEERLQFAVLSVQVAFALFLTFGSARFAILALREPRPSEGEEREVQ
jgi:hypothetical protein